MMPVQKQHPQHPQHPQRRTIPSLVTMTVLLVVVLAGPHPPAPRAQAHTAPTAPSHILAAPAPDGVHLQWQAATPDTAGLANVQPDLSSWPLVEIGGLLLPARLIPLRVDADEENTIQHTSIVPVLETLHSVPWQGEVQQAPVPIPHTPDGEARPDLAPTPDPTYPTAPVIILREGVQRGERIVVVAVTPVFARQGRVQVATSIAAVVPGTALYDPFALVQQELTEPPQSPPPTGAVPNATTTAAPATNPYAATTALKVWVTQAGIQRITGADIAATGYDPTTLVPAAVQLWCGGEEVALETLGTDDGVLNNTDELRFYAPSPGDRWNTGDTCWLTPGSPGTAGARMTVRDATPPTTPAAPATVAVEQGVWHNNVIYDSTLPGPDQDYWFAANLRTGPGLPAATSSATVTASMPPAAGTVVLNIRGSAYVSTTHRLQVRLGASSSSNTDTITWGGTGDWSHEVRLATTGTPGDRVVRLSLLPGEKNDGVELDSISWEWPVLLDAGGNGATFQSKRGQQHYQLASVPAGGALYDTTDPLHPVRLGVAPGTTTVLNDSQPPRSYVLAGPGTLHTPGLVLHQPVDLLSHRSASVIFIAPAQFHAALAPLVALRQAQGYQTTVVDVQAIYDVWSYGQVSPVAIRVFLRHAVENWYPTPFAVLLVGDGTSDPLNYTGKNNATFVPPYLADVDPWIGETACETCYAQLDGDDPLDDPLPDMAIGRLPVKSADELTAVVNKLVNYDTGVDTGAWRSHMVYFTDNYRQTDGSFDSAGDFAAFAEQSASQQPAGVTIKRMYYDPLASPADAPAYEPDAATAYQRTLALLNQGAGLVNYVGHGHYWQLAVTDLAADPPYLLSLYDVDTLVNGTRLPVVLQMSCLSSGFQQPANSGTTVDERLVLHPGGGAIGVWGSTGFGVSYGHDALQEGFYRTLWEDSTPPTLGTLTLAGYRYLFTDGICCQDSIHTFVLLGDPLTRPAVYAASKVYLPLTLRGG